jgi:hypothetical protein
VITGRCTNSTTLAYINLQSLFPRLHLCAPTCFIPSNKKGRGNGCLLLGAPGHSAAGAEETRGGLLVVDVVLSLMYKKTEVFDA